MATMILLPDSESLVAPHWVIVGSESTRWESLLTDNGTTSYVSCDDNLADMPINFADPDDVTPANGGVAEADIASYESVRFLSSGKSVHRTNPARVQIGYTSPDYSTHDEIVAYDAHRTAWETINGTARTTHDGTHPWDYSRISGMQLTCIKVQTLQVYLTYLAIEVTYTPAVAADNATFFGANF